MILVGGAYSVPAWGEVYPQTHSVEAHAFPLPPPYADTTTSPRSTPGGDRQDSTEVTSSSTDLGHTHEVGVVASSFFKLFEETQESYALNYRYRQTRKHSFRAGASYEYDSQGSGTFDLNARLGYDRVFLLDDHWAVYVGADVIGTHLRFDSGDRQTTLIGMAPLIGASVRIGSRLYISSEPRLLIRRGWQQTNGSVSERWWEMKLAGIGELIVSVRF